MNEAYSAYNIKNALRALAVDAIYDDDEVIYADELCCY